MSEYDEKRDEEELTEVEGHLRRTGAERVEGDDDDTPDVEGHVKRNSPAEQRPRPRPS